jgi:platelet-activating factor acetylhydrolase
MEAAALMGHSYGGATVTALCAHEPLFKCTVALDPWWAALMADQAALKQWETQSPLLMMGSHQWHTPDKNGNIYAGGARQKQIQQSASHRQTNGNAAAPGGGGSVLLVLEGSTHDSFTDVLPLFSERFGWIICLIGFKGKMDPALGINMITRNIVAFLNRHLPLTEGQRAFYHDNPLPAHKNGSKHKDKAVAASKGQLTAENNAAANGPSSQQSTNHSDGQQSAAEYKPASGARSCLPHVTADEKQVFEAIAGGHIAKLEVVP